jgi:transcriptional regulator of arginine metabolism
MGSRLSFLALTRGRVSDGLAWWQRRFGSTRLLANNGDSVRQGRIVAELIVSVRGSVNQIVLRTPPGSAMMVASAVDNAEWPEVLGTLGGDDTVLVLLSDPEKLPVVMQRFEDMRNGA